MPRCNECKNKGLIGGQAFVEYQCSECGSIEMWHNTNHPQLCDKCMKKAQNENRCVWCGKGL